MARYLAVSFSTLIVTFFAFSGQALAANPQISNIFPLTPPGVKFPIGQPLGISVVFSRSVYGFNLADVVANGRVVSVEGYNRNYRIVVIPEQRLLTLEIFADSARDSNGKGNDPILNGPFIFDTENSRVLSGGQYNPFFVAAAPVAVRQTRVVKKKEPVVEVKEKWNDAAQGNRFLLTLGLYSGGPKFINIEKQTPAAPSNSVELILGFETVKLFPKSTTTSGGFYLLTGYHRTLYAGGRGSFAENGGDAQTTASYTAIPLELGIGIHYRNFMSFNAGVISHLNGVYTHDGYLTIPGNIEPLKVDASANLVPQIGFAINWRFQSRKVGFNLRYVRMNLGRFTPATSQLGLSSQVSGSSRNYRTSNFFNSVGFFVNFNS